MRRPAAFFRGAVVALLLLLLQLPVCPSRWPTSAGGRADASPTTSDVAVRSGGVGVGGGGGSRWKHNKGGGVRQSQHQKKTADESPGVDLNVGILVPKTSFGVRGYLRAIHDALHSINKEHKKETIKTQFRKLYSFENGNVRYRMMSLTPSPTGR
ncbi:Hypothetical protein CINCED_3A012957 [Cinara cedri]|uniref:Uncharacterized protein n=1 Tax=Cinara cedri TaxID=506608 RepID=A0A5E4NAL5_9HEMI|nr:Hypothetical protein CINCED_3A012957 [Cinara cedri]